MRLFLDSANIDEIKEAFWNYDGILSGLTTNPTFFYKEGIGDISEFFKKINDVALVGELQIEAMGKTAKEIIEKCYELGELNYQLRDECDNITFKIPFSEEGLGAVSTLKIENPELRTNVHLVYSANQAALAIIAGATYVCPLLGRYDDIGSESFQLIDEIQTIIDNYSSKTEILAASIRHPSHVKAMLLRGVDVITIPYKVLKLMMDHPLTERGILAFNDHENG